MPTRLAALGVLLLGSAASAAEWRYELVPGDHLVFRQTLDRESSSPDAKAATHLAWTSHLLVLSLRESVAVIGAQRNRNAGELTRYEESGHDRLAAERPGFVAELIRRGRSYAESNRVTTRGERLLPWSVVREGVSELLPSIHELPPLPPNGASSWKEPGLFGLTLRASPEGACVRVKGEQGRVRLDYLVCEGALQSLDLDASYDTPVNRVSHERLRIERVERRRAETPLQWLDADDTSEGAVAALGAAERLLVPAAELDARLGRSPRLDAAILALRHRFRAVASPDAPAEDLEDRALAPIARAIWGDGVLPEWNCAVSDRAARVVRLRRAALQVTGTTLRVMRTPPFAGRPYVLHLPEDYSGDRPYPLLIALAGGPGRAVPMAQGLRAILAGLDAVVVMPDALGEMWWASGPTAAFPTLLREVMGEINVDPNRVWLTGFSNGGSGSFLYATLWPDRFAAVASQMGAGIRQFTGDPPGVGNLGALPFLFLHGDRDAIIPKSASEDTVKAIRREASAAPVSLEILPNHGHDLTLGSDDGRTLRFLLDKTRPAFPRRVVFEMRSALNARRDFVEIMKRKGSVARVEAEIGDDDVVRVRTKRVARLRLLLRRELFSGQGPLAVEVDGRRRFEGPLVEDCGMLLESWKETADPFLGYAMALELDLEK